MRTRGFDSMSCKCGFWTYDEDEANKHVCGEPTPNADAKLREVCPELADVKEKADKANDAPWSYSKCPDCSGCQRGGFHYVGCQNTSILTTPLTYEQCSDPIAADFEFMVAARNAVDAIKARMLELAEENEALRKLTRALGEDHPASVKNFLKTFKPIKDQKIHEMFEFLDKEFG